MNSKNSPKFSSATYSAGTLQIDPSHTFREYLTDYQAAARNKEVAAIVQRLGIDAGKLLALMNTNIIFLPCAWFPNIATPACSPVTPA